MALSSRAIPVALLLVGALLFTSIVSAVQTPAAVPVKEIYELTEQGRAALIADKPAEAKKFLEQAITKPGFSNCPIELQYFALMLASYAAQGTEDNEGAHNYLVAATRFPNADAQLWTRRAGTAASIGDWEDAAQSLTTVTKKWPKELKGDEYQSWLVNKITRELGKQPKLHPLRTDLLNALFDAGYKTRYGNEPSFLWLIAATDALEHKDLKRAGEISRRITDSSALVAMRIDKRFDELTAAEPKLFDVRAAAERSVRQAKTAMNDNPKSLGAVVSYGYRLHDVGQFDELLALANATIAKVDKASPKDPPYEDLEDQLNWIHNHKATALRALGRADEAAAALQAWNRSELNKGDKVSQAINLGFFYNEMGKPEDALKAVDAFEVGKGMSEYGSTQYQFVRFQAYQQLGKVSEANSIVAWMREHKDDSLETAQGTLLESGDVDGAAALLISRLNDPNERANALASVQHYAQTPRTERQKKLDAVVETFLSRADITAAIAQYGRRETFPIYSLEY